MRGYEKKHKDNKCKKKDDKWKKKCCCQSGNIFKCLNSIDKEIACFKELVPSKHLSRSTKEKVLICLILRDLGTIEKKLDRVLRELTSDWESNCVFDSHFDSDSESFCDSDSDSDSDSDCDSDCDSDSHRDH